MSEKKNETLGETRTQKCMPLAYILFWSLHINMFSEFGKFLSACTLYISINTPEALLSS